MWRDFTTTQAINAVRDAARASGAEPLAAVLDVVTTDEWRFMSRANMLVQMHGYSPMGALRYLATSGWDAEIADIVAATDPALDAAIDAAAAP